MTDADNQLDGPDSIGEISLDEIDKILKEDDPEFASSLGEIQSVGVEGEIEIESSVMEDGGFSEEVEVPRFQSLLSRLPGDGKWKERFLQLLSQLSLHWGSLRTSIKSRLTDLMLVSRNLPKEIYGYLKSVLIIVAGRIQSRIRAFLGLSAYQKLMTFSLAILVLGMLFIFKLNLSGNWIPQVSEPPITNWADVADAEFEFDRSKDTEPFLRAFPQEEHAFLFPKMIVNLKRTSGRNPMGAFEFYVIFDSQDAAVEAQMRKRELHDLLQRTVEEQTYEELDSNLGKLRLKDVVKRALNEVMTQGWAKEVLIKTFVLKP